MAFEAVDYLPWVLKSASPKAISLCSWPRLALRPLAISASRIFAIFAKRRAEVDQTKTEGDDGEGGLILHVKSCETS